LSTIAQAQAGNLNHWKTSLPCFQQPS